MPTRSVNGRFIPIRGNDAVDEVQTDHHNGGQDAEAGSQKAFIHLGEGYEERHG